MVVLLCESFLFQVDVIEGGTSFDFGVVRYRARQSRYVWMKNSGRFVRYAARRFQYSTKSHRLSRGASIAAEE